MRFTFPIKATLEVLEHSEQAKEHATLHGEKTTAVPGIWLVKDQGVYVMSNGRPRQLAEGANKDDKFAMGQVVYAEGWGKDTWLGGDDFVEPITAEMLRPILRAAQERDMDHWSIELNEETLRLLVG